jgi:ParB-like chromosome segregation protein Spo0J
LPRTAITEGERVRDDYGEIDRLALSLRKWGMLFPILVDQEYVLCDGGRRLRAAALAGLEFVPVTVREMTPEERAELELEVDREHKPLTDLERNKPRVKAAQDALAAMVAKASDEGRTISTSLVEIRKPGPKRARGDITTDDLADAVGVHTNTLRKAIDHVAAVEEFPELATIPKANEAIKAAKEKRHEAKLEADPAAAEAERKKQLERDANYAAARLREQFSRKLPALHDLTMLKPERLADVLTEGHWRTFDEIEENARRWFEEMRRTRARGLHLVG